MSSTATWILLAAIVYALVVLLVLGLCKSAKSGDRQLASDERRHTETHTQDAGR